MPKAITVNIGDKYGRLTIAVDLNTFPRKMQCTCECGNVVSVNLQRLTSGKTKSCGCIRREKTIEKNTTHGMSSKTEYGIWNGIRKRCLNENCKSYKDYGGRGIKICDRWSSFPSFLADIGHRPSDKMTIERIDVNGDYEPGNVRWATRLEQNRNNRNNRFVTINNETRCVSEWDIIFQSRHGIKPQSFKTRFYRWGLEKTLEWISKMPTQLQLLEITEADAASVTKTGTD